MAAWPPSPPPPPKKEILVSKKKYQTEKGSLTKNIGNFYECRKRLFFKGSYGWSTCQLKIIIGMYIKVNAVFLVSGQAEWAKDSTKIKFIAFTMCREVDTRLRKLLCYCENAFWANIRKKIKFFKPFGLDPPPPTSGHGTTSRVPLGSKLDSWCWWDGWSDFFQDFIVVVSKNAFFEARFGDLNKFGFFGGLMGHPNKIWQFSRMPALVRTYWGKFWKFYLNILPEILENFIWPHHL